VSGAWTTWQTPGIGIHKFGLESRALRNKLIESAVTHLPTRIKGGR